MKSINSFINEKLKINKNSKNSQKKKVKNYIELKNLIACEYEEQEHPEILDLNYIDITELDNLISLFDYDNDIKINNVDVSDWDVSNIRSFKETFASMKNFDCDLSNWNVSKGEDFQGMFIDCNKFDGKFLENWDMSNAKDIQFMLARCSSIKDNVDFTNWFENLNSISLKKQLYNDLKTCGISLNSDILHSYRDKYLS